MPKLDVADLPPGWLVPDWPAPPHVRAVMTSRHGGVSLPPCDSFNLGSHVGDTPEAVAHNRTALAARLGAQPVYLDQVHGQAVVQLARQAAPPCDGMQADACTTSERGLACTVMVADCLPVLLTTADGSLVGAAHAGWRGLAGGVLEAFFESFRHQALVKSSGVAMKNRVSEAAFPGQCMAWLGPCIGPERFEVGAEVRAAFVAQRPGDAACFQDLGQGKYLADLPALARRRLQALGITALHGNNSTPPWCTVSHPSQFFSHRRDGRSGRMAACVWRV